MSGPRSSTLAFLSAFFIFHIQTSIVMSASPVISNLPTILYVGEFESGERFLKALDIADAQSSACYSNISVTEGTDPRSTLPEFNVVYNALKDRWELWVSKDANFVTATNDITKFQIDVWCRDALNYISSVKYIEVQVVLDEAVTITAAGGETVTVSALSTVSGEIIKTFTANSLLCHELVYSMSVDPSMAPYDEYFALDVTDTYAGDIRTNREMKYLDTGTSSLTLTLMATDLVDKIQTYEVVFINMEDQNTIPRIENLEATKKESKLECLDSGDPLLTLTVVDPDSSQSHTFSFTTVPAQCETLLNIDKKGNLEIAASRVLDHETLPFCEISVYVDDGYHTGGPFMYELTIDDCNEEPVFSESMYYATITEGAKRSVTFDPGFVCTDVDSGDDSTFELAAFNNSDRFFIDPDTGLMSLAVDYDVDNNLMPSNAVFTVYCVDSGEPDGLKLTGTTQISLTIRDANDNAPVFSDSSYTFYFNQNTNPGDVIGTLTPTDADSGTNAAVTCSGVSSDTYGSSFTVHKDCTVTLNQAETFPSETHTEFDITATDGPGLTGTSAVGIIYREITTTRTAATTTKYNLMDHPENIAMLVMLLQLSLLLLGILGWCLARVCCGCGQVGGGSCECLRGGRTKIPPPGEWDIPLPQNQ